jgi:hypothetical protein
MTGQTNAVRGLGLALPGGGRLTGALTAANQAPDPVEKLIMHCDVYVHGAPCTNTPRNAPRVIVPAVDWMEPGHIPVRMMTKLHLCDIHWEQGVYKLEDFLTDRIKAEMEALAKRARPHGYKLDFDNAFLERVLTTTPEYRQYMQSWGMAYAGG